jgi:hypothetical protein
VARKSDKNLKPFVKGYDPRRHLTGAPRKVISTFTDIGYTNKEIQDTIRNITSLTEKEVMEVEKNPECSILERTVAKAMLIGMKKGSLWNLETVITRAFGKPVETSASVVDNKIEVVFVDGKSIT